METTLRTINAVISALFFICYTYQFLYIPLVLAKKAQAPYRTGQAPSLRGADRRPERGERHLRPAGQSPGADL